MTMTLSQVGLRTLLALLAGGAVAALVSSETLLSLLTQAVIFALFATGIGVLLRQNGHVSFGHALFFGGAGYGVGVLLKLQLVSAELAIVLTLGGLALAAFVIGLAIVRVPGIAFGMVTLAMGQMAFLSVSRARGFIGGADGLNIEWPASVFGIAQADLFKPITMFMLSWVTLVLTLCALALLLRSRFGSITEAVRDNEERARFIGIATLLPRAAVYALSAFVSGMAGILAALNTGFVSPETLHWSLSGMTLMMVIVGGAKALWGPALGAIVYFMFKDVVGDYATHWMSIFGVVLITVIVFAPHGLAGLLQKGVSRWRGQAPAAGAPRAPVSKTKASEARA
jgi:branched-chain amino acid transport system permease protein